MKKHIIIIIYALLILGLLFTEAFGFKFHLHHGFSFDGFWLRFPLNIFDFGGDSSDLFLTSHLIGYLFYLGAGYLIHKNYPVDKQGAKLLLPLFFAIVTAVFISDFYSYYQDLNNIFAGRHLKMGGLVFLIGALLVKRIRNSYKQIELQEESNLEKK